MSSTLNHIRSYIALLHSEFALNITLHDHYLSLINELAEYNFHTNPYCLCMKTNYTLWQDECVFRQKYVVDKCKTCGKFFGMCHAGVCEYVYPVTCDGEFIAFLSVSGYRPSESGELYSKAMHKLSKLCDKYNLNRDSVITIYNKYLTDKLPDEKKLDALIQPLCDMLTFCVLERRSVAKVVAPTPENSARQRLYYDIVNRIWNDHNSRVNLESLCAQLNYSKSYISHVFKAHSGMTINRYVNMLRISEAKAMLSATELPIQEIALTIGFTDSNYFTNVFRSECGMSPREWRRAHSGEKYMEE